ncbi:MAG: ABC transporter permease, partial [Actinomycetota bacterium]|nr:ABC transporter permease [Actinomycetota bacterium]
MERVERVERVGVTGAVADVGARPTGLGELCPRRLSRPPWVRALGYFLFRWRRTFRSTLAGNFVYPVLYLAAIGVGLGGLVDHHLHGGATAAGLSGGSYLAFVTPGLLAGSVMQIALGESTYPVMGAIRWERSYETMLATPLEVTDVLLGHLAFVAVRVLTAAVVFVAVAAAFGALASPEAVLAVPVAVLVGAAFAAPLMAFSVTRERDLAFSTLQRLVIVPLFLFSGSFFPLRQLPGILQGLAEATPLYHGVALARTAMLGTPWRLADVGHAGYLVVLTAIGYVLARRTYRRR